MVPDVGGDDGPGVDEAGVARRRVPDRDRLVGQTGTGAAGVLAAQREALAVLDQARELLPEPEDVLVSAELEVEGQPASVDHRGGGHHQAGHLPQPVRRPEQRPAGGGILQSQREGRSPDPQAHPLGGDDDLALRLLDRQGRRGRRGVDHDAQPRSVVRVDSVSGRGEREAQRPVGGRADPQLVGRRVGGRKLEVGEVRHGHLDALLQERLASEPARHHPELDCRERVDGQHDGVLVAANRRDAAQQKCLGHGGYPFTEPAVMPATK